MTTTSLPSIEFSPVRFPRSQSSFALKCRAEGMPMPPATVWAIAYDRILDGDSVTITAERNRLSGHVTWTVNGRQIVISTVGGIESMS